MATKKDDGLYFTGRIFPDFSIKLNGKNLAVYLNQFLESDEDVEIYIKKIKVNKTLQQIRYWFGVVIPHVENFIAETEGIRHGKDKIHIFLMSSYGDANIVEMEMMGKKFNVIERASLADYSKEQAMLIIDTVINAFAIQGLTIPEPISSGTGTISDY